MTSCLSRRPGPASGPEAPPFQLAARQDLAPDPERVGFQRDSEGSKWKGRVNPATAATRSHAQGLPWHGEDRAEVKG